MIVGMDFGTTNSGMAVYDGSQLHLIPLDPASSNPYVARTALYLTNDRLAHIGRDATETYYEQNLNRPFKLERVRIGEIEMTFAEVGTFIKDVYVDRDIFSPGRLFVSFKMGLSSPGYIGTVIGNYYYFLEDIIATYLYTTRKRAEAFLETDLDTIVLGRPVRFSDDDDQNTLARERLLAAAFRAGYKRVYLQYEPIAAAYYYEQAIDSEHNVLIFDFGGGTLDMSVLRVGNPKTRRVLSTGGIPIAGDVFDRKIVRKKLPPHFGEGSTYRHNGDDLPVPSNFYEAFTNWQDLLALQRPDRLEILENIARTARYPVKINALIKLVTSHFGLKVYDIAEVAKRKLSDRDTAHMRLKGPGFLIHESITRSEFEKLIRTDIRAISERLDRVIADAGLKPDQIDAVIRTGGSSQIPAFIDMLHERFGAEKVRDLDVFSSVTSGLGIIAHRVEKGEIDLPCYTPDAQIGGEYLNSKHQGGIPVVDIDLMKQFIDLKESQEESGSTHITLMHNTEDNHLRVTLQHPEQFTTVTGLHEIGIADGLQQPVLLTPAQSKVLLMTTDYRTFLKSAEQLADLDRMGLKFAEVENLRSDQFDDELVCMATPWDALKESNKTLLVSTLGYARVFLGEAFINKLDQPVPYQISKSRGFPAALLNISEQGELIAVNHAGRAVRMPTEKLTTLEQRILTMPLRGSIISAFSVQQPTEMIIATSTGYAKRIHTDALSLSAEMNTSGEKISNRANPVAALPLEPGSQLLAVTTQRILPVDQQTIPLLTADTTTDHKIIKLKKGESLVTLAYLPATP